MFAFIAPSSLETLSGVVTSLETSDRRKIFFKSYCHPEIVRDGDDIIKSLQTRPAGNVFKL